MMRTATYVLVLLAMLLLLLLLVVSPAQAGGCAIVVRKHAAVVHHAVVVPKVAVYETIHIPLYSATYQGTDPAVIELFRQLGGRLDRLERGGQPQPQPAPQPTPQPAPTMPPAATQPVDPFNPGAGPQAVRGGSFLEQVQAKCAGCHSGASARGGVKLLENGQLAQLTPEQVGDVVDAVVSARMPPPKAGQRMSAEERLAFIQAMVRK